MHKINKHIEIVSSEIPELSSMGEKSRNAIKNTLSKYYSRVGITIINKKEDLNRLLASKPDLVFLGMKFIPKNPLLGFNDPYKVWIYEFLANNGILSTGSSSSAHKLELYKPLAKQKVLDSNLATSPFLIVKPYQQPDKSLINMQYPLFVKPADRGGGVGIDIDSVVHNYAELNSKINIIADELGSDTLIEMYLPGREFSVAIMYSEVLEAYHTMPLEIIAPKNEKGDTFLSNSIKKADSEECTNIIDRLTEKEICTFALRTFHSLGASDYGRIDIRLDHNNVPHFIEANLLPGLITGSSYFSKACLLNLGMDYEEMILRITKLGLSRVPESAYSDSELAAVLL